MPGAVAARTYYTVMLHSVLVGNDLVAVKGRFLQPMSYCYYHASRKIAVDQHLVLDSVSLDFPPKKIRFRETHSLFLPLSLSVYQHRLCFSHTVSDQQLLKSFFAHPNSKICSTIIMYTSRDIWPTQMRIAQPCNRKACCYVCLPVSSMVLQCATIVVVVVVVAAQHTLPAVADSNVVSVVLRTFAAHPLQRPA